MKPGQSRTFTVDNMAAGTYALVCNIAKHYGLGMRAPFAGDVIGRATSDGPPAIGWLRAILTATIIVVVGIGVLCVRTERDPHESPRPRIAGTW